MSPRLVRSLRGAAAFVDRVGLAVVFPSDDLVLPSLWEAVAGDEEIRWSTRDPEGRFVEFTPEFARVWRWKDELPEQRLVCVGKHVRGRAALVSLQLLGALYGLTGRPGKTDDFRGEELSPVELAVAEAALDHGPCTSPELHELTGHERKHVQRAIDRLQRRLVLTGAGAQEQDRGWPAVVFDVLARRYRQRLRRVPQPGDARRELAAVVLRSAHEVSAADLAAVLGSSRKEAAAALDELVDEGSAGRRPQDDFMLWTAR